MKKEELEQVQLERLQSTLNRAYKNVPFYRRQFDALGIHPGKLTAVEGIRDLPFTTRQDLCDDYPYGLFAVPLRDIVRISPSAGTTAKPVVVGFTKSDLKARENITARYLTAGGVRDTDVVQICLNPGLSSWGRALKEGAESIGASVMPLSLMSTSKQLMAMEDYKTSILVTTPSYAMHMLDVMKTNGKKAESLALKAVLLVGEVLTEEWRDRLQTAYKVNVFAGYGPSDVMAPGVAFECKENKGLHVNEDHFVVEIVDPQSGELRLPGQEGEVVLTTLTAKAFPLVRFRTGDIASALDAPCPCGRTFVRISAITGYTGDVLTIRGVKAHPNQIEQILADDFGRDRPRFLIHLYKEKHLDMIEICLEMTETLFSDEVKGIENTLKQLQKRMFQLFGLETTIRLMEASTLDQHKLAPGGIIDDRGQNLSAKLSL
jgi:phenylacetate-CoA ligase